MGPPSFMQSVVGRNVVMRLMTVMHKAICTATRQPHMVYGWNYKSQHCAVAGNNKNFVTSCSSVIRLLPCPEEQDRQRTYEVTLWRVRAIVVVEEQWVLHILSVCL